jgi:hypothetical protein
MAGTVSQAVFCLAYAHTARRAHWPLAIAAGALAFGLSTLTLRWLPLSLVPLALVAVATLFACRRLMPRLMSTPRRAAPLPWWDIPARMVVTTGFVLLLTGAASYLGPRLTGLMAPLPIYGAILVGFTHALEGPARAAGVLRGLLLGLYGFVGFFVVLAALLERTGIAAAFTAAAAVALLVQAGALWMLRRGVADAPAPIV